MSLPPEQIPMQRPIRKVAQSGEIILAPYPQLARRNVVYNGSVASKDLESVINKCRQYYNRGEFQLEIDYLEAALIMP